LEIDWDVVKDYVEASNNAARKQSAKFVSPWVTGQTYKKEKKEPLRIVRFFMTLGASSALSPWYHSMTQNKAKRTTNPTKVPMTSAESQVLRTPPQDVASKKHIMEAQKTRAPMMSICKIFSNSDASAGLTEGGVWKKNQQNATATAPNGKLI
jgi:hypothetical protein